MSKSCTCGCCEGVEKLTPLKIANRPMLNALRYRVGTHATFLETMIARLTDLNLNEPEAGEKPEEQFNPLLKLKTRDRSDPSLALLDAWANVGDILTFYQERIANEGFLRTAIERRSLLEMANLVGYRLRPGVASTVYLAFTMEPDHIEKIPVGIRAQSIPGPGEKPQLFETAEAFEARAVWNELKPRMKNPQFITAGNFEDLDSVYFKGTDNNLKVNDPLLFIFQGSPDSEAMKKTVESVEENAEAGFTKVLLSEPPPIIKKPVATNLFTVLRQLVRPLSKPVSFQPARATRLNRNKNQLFSGRTDIAPQLLVYQNRALRKTIYDTWARTRINSLNIDLNKEIDPSAEAEAIMVLRVKAGPFGHNAPKKAMYDAGAFTGNFEEWDLGAGNMTQLKIALDTTYEGIKKDSWVTIERPGNSSYPRHRKVVSVDTVSESNYGMAGTVTLLTLDGNWIDIDPTSSANKLSNLRDITVFAQSEPLELSEAPVEDDISGNTIELNGLFDALTSGRWAIVSGERTDIREDDPGQAPVVASELVMLSGVEQRTDPNIPVDTPHTYIQFANQLAYKYKRDTVKIFGNVVRATHGETRTEILGSGDSSKALQQFLLKQSPVTYVSAVSPDGIESTLEIRANNVEWEESDSLADKKGDERIYTTKINNDNKTTIFFGNGEQGARLPSGVENITAVYRVGIGQAGNVRAEQISMLVTKPLGVKTVINPLEASGGADREELAQAKRNAPIHLRALDRTVSVSDYADFARAFTGIGKADAIRISDGRRELVHLTIAGTDDIPIDETSDLFRNLLRSLHTFGDPNQPLKMELRELMLIVASARVKLLPAYKWEFVEPEIRRHVLEVFGFENRAMGQDVLLSDLISTIQFVEGVDYVDVDILDALDGDTIVNNLENLAERLIQERPKNRVIVRRARVNFSAVDADKRILPSQLAILTPDIPDTLILSEITS